MFSCADRKNCGMYELLSPEEKIKRCYVEKEAEHGTKEDDEWPDNEAENLLREVVDELSEKCDIFSTNHPVVSL